MSASRRSRGHRVRRVVVVFCHPVRESLVGAATDRTMAALQTIGHDVRLIDLYGEHFDPVLDAAGLKAHLDAPETKTHLTRVAASLRWCDTLVFVYPTWFGSQPAMLKGWFDRMLAHGVAFALPSTSGAVSSATEAAPTFVERLLRLVFRSDNRIRPTLTNVRRLLVVTTHGSPKWINAIQGEPGKRVILRGIRSLCHPFATSRWISFYDNDQADQRDRADFLNRVEAEMLRL